MLHQGIASPPATFLIMMDNILQSLTDIYVCMCVYMYDKLMTERTEAKHSENHEKISKPHEKAGL